jgi:hypothetical protein
MAKVKLAFRKSGSGKCAAGLNRSRENGVHGSHVSESSVCRSNGSPISSYRRFALQLQHSAQTGVDGALQARRQRTDLLGQKAAVEGQKLGDV